MIPTEELRQKLLETLTPDQAAQTTEQTIKNRVITYCYKVPREEEIQHMYEYITSTNDYSKYGQNSVIPTRVY